MKIPFETALYGTLRHLPAKSRIPYLLVLFLLNLNLGWGQNPSTTFPSYSHLSGVDLVDQTITSLDPDEIPISIDVAPDNSLYILTFGNGIEKRNSDGVLEQANFISGLSSPLDFAIDDNGFFYIADYSEDSECSQNGRIKIFRPNGTFDRTIHTGIYRPIGIEVDGDGNIYVAEYNQEGNGCESSELSRLSIYNSEGSRIDENTNIFRPYRLAVSQDKTVYLSQEGNGDPAVLILDSNLNITGRLPEVQSPGSIMIDHFGFIHVVEYAGRIDFSDFVNFENLSNTEIQEIAEEIDNGIDDEAYFIRIYDQSEDYKDFIKEEIDFPVDLAFNQCDRIYVDNAFADGTVYPFFGYIPEEFEFDLEIYTRSPSFDITAPEITCPPDITVQADPGKNAKEVEYDMAVASDLCGVSVVKTSGPNSGDPFPIGTTDVVFTATDSSGKSTTCTLQVTVDPADEEPLTILNCNYDVIEVTTDENCEYIMDDFTDDFAPSDSEAEIMQDPEPGQIISGEVNVTLTPVLDGVEGETCSFTVRPDDINAPDVTSCPEDDIIVLNADETYTIPDYQEMLEISDNCDSTPDYTQNPPAGTKISETTPVTITVTDASDNFSECTFIIEISKEELSITCPENQTINFEQDCSYTLPDYTDEASATQGATITQDPVPGSVFTSKIDVTLTAQLDGQSETCTFEVMPIDVTPPEIICPDDIIKEIPSDQSTTVVNYNEPQVFDNCESELNVTLIDGPISGSTLEEGEYIVEYMVTDEAGLEARCEFEIIITKQEPSDFEIACSNHELVLDANGRATLDPEILYAGQENNLSFEASQTEFNCSDLGVNQITLTATDPDTGETATCNAEIFILNEIEPQAACVPSGTEFRMINGELNLTPSDINDGSSAVCELKMELSQTRFTTPGNKTITLTVFDKSGASDSCTTTISVVEEDENPLNSAPVAKDDNYSVDQDDVLIVIAPGVLDNDTDAEDDALTAIVEDSPQNGTLSLSSDGSFTYEPNAGFSGPDSFTYIANDGSDDSNVATVSITVNALTPGNTAPVANDDNYSVDQDDVLNIQAPGILENDTDAENDALTAIVEDSPQNGTLSLNSDGSFNYEPNAGYSGPDSFTYKANDGSDDSNVATVRITVNSLSEDFQCIETPINLQLNQSGSANVTLNDLYSGDATGLNLVASQLEFNCEDIGENVIELSWTGERSGSCEITVVVEDNMQPSAKVSFISVTLDENGIAEIEPEDLDNGSSDNCGEVIFSVSKSRFTCEDTGQNTVSLTLTDPSGNSTSLNTIVFVNANPGSCTEPPRDNDYVFLYPNPTDGLVKISTPRDITVEQVFVFDKRGRFILSKAFDKSDQEYELQIDGVQNAVYTLRIITNEDEIIRRLIIRN